MSSRIKHIVEPVLGWSFVLLVIVILVGVLLSATRPIEGAAPIPIDQAF